MPDDVYTRTFRRAIEAVGDSHRLARMLGASVEEIEAWSTGSAVPPPGAFLAAIEIGSQRRVLASSSGSS